jgi:hypothetical protein
MFELSKRCAIRAKTESQMLRKRKRDCAGDVSTALLLRIYYGEKGST